MRKETVLTWTLAAGLVTSGVWAAPPKPCNVPSACDPCGPVQPCDDADFGRPAFTKGDAFRFGTSDGACDPCAAASCDPCDPAGCGPAACDPCEAVTCGPCDPIDDDLSCGTTFDENLKSCEAAKRLRKQRSSRLSVYGSAAALVGSFDGGYFRNSDNSKLEFGLGGGVAALVGVQRGQHAIEVGYKGLYQSLSRSWYKVGTPPIQRVNVINDFQSCDASFVLTLARFPSIQLLAGVGYNNLSVHAKWHTTGDVYLATDTVRNEMLGVHLGGKWSKSVGRHFGIATYGKLGVYANTVDVKLGGANPLKVPYGNCTGAWGTSCGIDINYKLTRCMSSFVGYDMTMIEGVERGGFVIDDIRGSGGIPTARGLATDRVLAHGLTVGLKCNY